MILRYRLHDKENPIMLNSTTRKHLRALLPTIKTKHNIYNVGETKQILIPFIEGKIITTNLHPISQKRKKKLKFYLFTKD